MNADDPSPTHDSSADLSSFELESAVKAIFRSHGYSIDAVHSEEDLYDLKKRTCYFRASGKKREYVVGYTFGREDVDHEDMDKFLRRFRKWPSGICRMYMTNRDFTEEAQRTGSSSNLLLWNREELIKEIGKFIVNIYEKAHDLSGSPAEDTFEDVPDHIFGMHDEPEEEGSGNDTETDSFPEMGTLFPSSYEDGDDDEDMISNTAISEIDRILDETGEHIEDAEQDEFIAGTQIVQPGEDHVTQPVFQPIPDRIVEPENARGMENREGPMAENEGRPGEETGSFNVNFEEAKMHVTSSGEVSDASSGEMLDTSFEENEDISFDEKPDTSSGERIAWELPGTYFMKPRYSEDFIANTLASRANIVSSEMHYLPYHLYEIVRAGAKEETERKFIAVNSHTREAEIWAALETTEEGAEEGVMVEDSRLDTKDAYSIAGKKAHEYFIDFCRTLPEEARRNIRFDTLASYKFELLVQYGLITLTPCGIYFMPIWHFITDKGSIKVDSLNLRVIRMDNGADVDL